MLVPVDWASVEATDRVAVESKTSGLIGPVAELVQEISVPAIALAVGQLPAAWVLQPVRCPQTAAAAQIASVIALSHQAPGSVQVTTLLVAAGLEAPPLDRPVIAEAPAWEAVDSPVVEVVAAVSMVAEDAAAAAAGVEDRQTID